MAEGIKKSDLIQGDPINSIRLDLDALTASLEKMDKGFVSMAATLSSKINPLLDKTSKGIKEINQADIASEKLIRDKLLNEDKLAKIKITNERLSQAELRGKIQINKEAERQVALTKREIAAKEKANKVADKAKQTILDEANAYKQLTAATNKAQAELKRLAAQHGVGSRQARAAKREFDRLDNSLRKVNDAARDGRRDVGRYGKAWTAASSALSKVGISIGIGFAAREGIKVLAEYDEKIADIRKTTGLSSKDATFVSAELLKLDTKTSITNLQDLAVAAGRLNITGTKDVVDFAKAADVVFVALGDDLEGTADEIATSLGKISSQFGLEKEFGIGVGITKVGSGINELAANSKASAPAILDFTNRMIGLSDVLSLEDAGALGALFDESGQSIEIAATTIQNVLPSLAKDFERFSKIAGMTPEAFKKIAEESPIEALKAVAVGAKSSEKGLFALTDMLESYGITSARASGIVGVLTNNVDRLTELQNLHTKALDDGTSAADEFDLKNDTLSATLAKATKKIQEQLIAFNQASGFAYKLKETIKFLVENMGAIVKVGSKVLVFLAIYAARQKILNSGVLDWTRNLFKNKAALLATADATKKAGDAAGDSASKASKFGSALKGMGVAIAIQGLIELAMAWWKVASGTQQAEHFQLRYNAAQTKGGKIAQGIEDANAQRYQDEINRIKLLKLSATEEAKQIKAVTEARENQLKGDIKFQRNAKDESLRLKAEAIAKRKEFFDNNFGETAARGFASGAGILGGEMAVKIALLDAAVTLHGANIANATARLDVYKSALTSTSQSVVDLKIAELDAGSGTDARVNAIKEETKAYKDLSNSIDEILNKGKSLEEIEDEEISLENDAIQEALTKKFIFINDSERLITMTTEQAQDQRIIAELEALLERKRILEFYGRDTLDIELEISAKRLELSQESSEDMIELEKDSTEEMYEIYKNFQEALTDVLKDQIDARILELKREEDAAKSQQDYFESLAANGNITAQQSITEMIELQREAQAEQARLEKVKQNIEMISAGIKTFTASLEEGQTPAEALATTLTTTQVLAGILGNMNFFEKGTDNAPKGWAVVDEIGAEIITDKKGNIKDFGSGGGARFKYLEQGDKVTTASKSMNLLNRFDQIGMGELVSKSQDKVGNSFDMMIINQSLQDMRGDMNKLQTKYEMNWDGLARVIPSFSVTKNKGGDQFIDRYTAK